VSIQILKGLVGTIFWGGRLLRSKVQNPNDVTVSASSKKSSMIFLINISLIPSMTQVAEAWS
jgi:hypothetical protein